MCDKRRDPFFEFYDEHLAYAMILQDLRELHDQEFNEVYKRDGLPALADQLLLAFTCEEMTA